NALAIAGKSLGLQQGFFGDDVDGLNVRSGPSPNVYFAIDRFSATNGFGVGTLASDLLVSAQDGRFSIYATNAMMRLNPRDAIDDLVLRNQALDQRAASRIDKALLTLDPFPPDVFTSNFAMDSLTHAGEDAVLKDVLALKPIGIAPRQPHRHVFSNRQT